MLGFASSSTQSSNGRTLPPRSDSLRRQSSVLTTSDILPTLGDELRDARRVQTHGQEEDLRDALGRMIGKVEEISNILTQAYREKTEIETQLILTKSNLQLALANNEMLEEHLKRDSAGKGRDVGWRRWSERVEGTRAQQIAEESAAAERRATTRKVSMESQGAQTPTLGTPGGSPMGSPVPSSATPTAPTIPDSPNPPTGVRSPTMPQPEPSSSRLFRFRFGGSSVPTPPASASASLPSDPRRPQSPPTPSSAGVSVSTGALTDDGHGRLTSASLPSLHAGPSKREIELESELEAEKTRHREMCDAKKALEAELESLSQALFEEANKMVSQERRRRAEIEEELAQARQEKDALKGALQVIESENGHLRARSVTDPMPEALNGGGDSVHSLGFIRGHKKSSSSVAVLMSVSSSTSSSPAVTAQEDEEECVPRIDAELEEEETRTPSQLDKLAAALGPTPDLTQSVPEGSEDGEVSESSSIQKIEESAKPLNTSLHTMTVPTSFAMEEESPWADARA